MAEKLEHPLDKQNALEREIQLKGGNDPDNFKMPDGRTLTEVKNELETEHQKEFDEETQMILDRTREMAMQEFHKGGDLVMTKTGVIIDTMEPPVVESVRKTEATGQSGSLSSETASPSSQASSSAPIASTPVKAPSIDQGSTGSLGTMQGSSTPSK